MYDISILTDMLLPELKEAAEKLLIPKAKIAKSKKPELIDLILKMQEMNEPEVVETTNETIVNTTESEAINTNEITAKTEIVAENNTTAEVKKERVRIPRKAVGKVVPIKKENPFSDRNAMNAEFAKENMHAKPISKDFEKLKKVSQELGEICDDKILKDMIFAADLDGDGKVSKEEFMRVMRKMKLI